MANRPIFIPDKNLPYVKKIDIEFQWFAGFAISQKQKSIASLHDSAKKSGYSNPLEVSTKSSDPLGKRLSAFNLKLRLETSAKEISVESAFQGGKVFSGGGPYTEFYNMTGREIKGDERLKNSGKLLKFVHEGIEWGLEPKTIFYDWLYISALNQNHELADKIIKYDCFTDIEFNPKKSFNCQAISCALYVSLYKINKLDECLRNPERYKQMLSNNVQKTFSFGQ